MAADPLLQKDIAALIDANREFYRAFRERDMEAMEKLWARDRPVACIHPGWDALTDFDEIMESWRQIFAAPQGPDIRPKNEQTFLHGDTAFVICHEAMAQGALVATNIFIRQRGLWRVAHHQAGQFIPVPKQARRPPGTRVH